jgi:hypothetical protein
MSALGHKQTLRPQIGMAMTAKQRKTTAKTVRAKHSSTIIVR